MFEKLSAFSVRETERSGVCLWFWFLFRGDLILYGDTIQR